jgi:hypothetical protein
MVCVTRSTIIDFYIAHYQHLHCVHSYDKYHNTGIPQFTKVIHFMKIVHKVYIFKSKIKFVIPYV